MKNKMIEEFRKAFGPEGEVSVYFAPGRVNLIGEHTDYNGGHVFPCALDIGTYCVVRAREDRKLRFYSSNFEDLGIIESSLDDLVWSKEADWTNYPKGVMWAFMQKGYSLDQGYDFYLFGNIPNGAGLSSSASVEVVTGTMLKDQLGLDISMVDIALMGQFSENQYNGVNCGIMDQFAVAMGKKNHAVYLNTDTLEYTYAPLNIDGYKIVIGNTNKKRGLEDSDYNNRRGECEEALADLQTVKDIKYLCQLNNQEFESLKATIKNEKPRKRAAHVISEDQRCLQAVEALKKDDLEAFGQLMNASHQSLQDDFCVTGKELDTLAHAAQETEGCIGARMTGAGFGGCTVALVREDAVENFVREVGAKYKETIGYAADFYVVEAGDGARKL